MSDSGGLITTAELPATAVLDSAGVSAPLADQAGNQLVNIPAWQALTLYPSGYVIQNGGVAYAATATFTSGASFGADGANWAPLSSAELGFASITSAFTTTSAAFVDVTALTTTVTVAGRPILIRVSGAFLKMSAAGAIAQLNILEDGVSVRQIARYANVVNSELSMDMGVRRNPGAGAHTYKVQAASDGTNTVTVQASATNPAEIQVLAV